MSEFIAEARVLVTPDTKLFRTKLEAELRAATLKPIPVPVIPVASTAATGQVLGAQKTLQQSTQKSTQALLGAATATARLDSALLGLRTAVGSTAVIGLGALSLAAIAAGKAFRAMTLDAAAFEAELNTFQAVTGATADQMERVGEAAQQLGADVRLPAVSSADAAIAMTELAKAGLSVQDSIAGAAGVLQLATAAQLSNADAAKIAANALNSFGLAGSEATEVADNFANAANAAQGSVADIGIAMQQASAVARQVGLSLQDTTSLLALFAKNGLQGSDAGTSLRVALIRLVAPTKEAAAEIKKLGLNIRDANGNVRPDVFAQFGEATKDLAPAARDASAALIFGQDAIRAVAIGAREGERGLRVMQFQIDQTGTAADVAAARTKGFAGELSGLQSNLQTLGTSLGGFTNSVLGPLVRGLNEASTAVNKLISALPGLQNELNPDPTGETNSFFARLGGSVRDLINPMTRLRHELGLVGDGSLTASQQARLLTNEIKALEKARIAAELGGASELADRLTKSIQLLRGEVKNLNAEGSQVSEGVNTPLQETLEILLRLRENAGAEDIPFLNALIREARELIPITIQTEGNIQRLRDDFLDLANASNTAADALDKQAQAMKGLQQAATTTSDKLQAAQAAGAGPQAQIALLQQSNRDQQAIIAEAEKGGRQSGDITTIRKARAQIIANNNQIESLQNEIAADQREATAKTKKAADDAAKLSKEQTEAFIELFGGGRQRRIQQAELAAGLTESAKDDLAVDLRIKKFLQDKLKAIRDRIKRLGLTGDALKVARDAIRKIIDEIDQINADIAEDTQRLAQQRADRTREVLELDISLAEERGNEKAEVRARERFIAFLKKQQDLVKRGSVEWKRLQLEIEQQQNAIDDANKSQKDSRKSAAAFFFEQLQAQQGFAANLLGNLITGPTAGLVGNPAPSPERGVIAQGTAADGRARAGVTGGQAERQTNVLQKILLELRKLNGSYDAPEAIHQKKVGAAGMDYTVL